MAQVSAVVTTLTALVPFFPFDLEAKGIISTEIYKFVGTVAQLNWFKTACIQQMPKWQSVPHLRAIYATRYSPADGLPAVLQMPGYSPADQEARFFLREVEENDKRLAGYRRQAQLAPPEDRAPFLLPAPAAISEAEPEAASSAKFEPDRGGSGIVRKPKPSLKERQALLAADLALQAKAASNRSEAELAAELGRVYEKLEGLRAKEARTAPVARGESEMV